MYVTRDWFNADLTKTKDTDFWVVLRFFLIDRVVFRIRAIILEIDK